MYQGLYYTCKTDLITLCMSRVAMILLPEIIYAVVWSALKSFLARVTLQLLDGWIKQQYWKEKTVHIWTLVETSVSPSYFIHQCSSDIQSCPTLWDPVNCSMPGLPVHHQLSEFTQTHVHWVSDAIQPSHPLSSPSPPAFNLSQHQCLFQWVSSLHQVANVLEFKLQHQSF